MAFGVQGEVRALVVGATGGLGGALCQLLSERGAQVWGTARRASWAPPHGTRALVCDLSDEASIAALAASLDELQPNVVINASGLLHDGELQPERTWRSLRADHLHRLFDVHAVGPSLLAKHVIPQIPRRERAVFIQLSARVGSIADNRLGGWYGYRASKAAGNMMLKCVALEARRSHPKLVCVALHPGTVATDLSQPFRGRVAAAKLLSPKDSARHLEAVAAGLEPSQTGSFWGWDGAPIPW